METYEEILKAASEMFLRYGIRSISMDELATQLGISKKTIYRFFENKDALVMAFAEEFTKNQEKEILHLMESSGNVIEELLNLSHYMRNKVCCISPALIFDLKKYYPKAWMLAENLRNGFTSRCVCITLNKGIETGHFRKNIIPEILATLRVHQINLGFDEKVFPLEQVSMTDVQMQMFEHFVYGICTLKGHKLFNQYRQINEEE